MDGVEAFSPELRVAPERNGKRVTVATWLQHKARPLAELYIGALHLTYQLALPGRTRLVAHAVREICNALPVYVAGATTARIEYPGRLDSVGKGWAGAGLPRESAEIGSDLVLPPKLASEILDLLLENETRSHAIDSAAQLFAAADPGNTGIETLQPLAKKWRDDTEWAVQHAHDPRKDVPALDDEELRRRFELFEDHVFGLGGPYFNTQDALDAILEDANS